MSRIPFFLVLLLPVAASSQTTPATTPEPSTPTPANTAPLELDPVVVTDKLDKAREDIVPSLGAAEFHIDRLQLDAQALGLNASFNNLLLRAPGVAQDSFGQVHVRGEHGDLQYRINDVLLPEGLTGFGQELDTRFAESVNILTGALPAQYGYRTAGVVDIHTRSSAETGGDLALSGGSADTLHVSAEDTATHGKLGAYVTASAEQSDLGIENPTPAHAALHDRKTQEKAFGYFSYVLDDTSRLNLLLSGSFARFQIPNTPGERPAFSLAGVPRFDSAALDENQREENHYAILAYEKSAGEISAQISAYTRYSLVAFTPDRAGDLIFNGTASRVHRAIVGNGLEADAKWSVAADHTVRGGLLTTSTNAGTRTTTTVFPTDADGTPTSTVPFDINDNQRKLGWLAGAYAQDEWKLSPTLTANFGLRADTAHGYLNEGQLSPRLNLVYQISATTAVHAGYARYFTPPPLELVQTSTIGKFAGTTNQAASDVSSPVRSERAHYFDAGIATKLTSNLSATVDLYDKEAKNVLDEGQFGTALIFSPFNYRIGRVSGVEFASNYTSGQLAVYGNLAFNRGEGRDIVSGEFQFDPTELAYIARHDVHFDHDQQVTASAGVSDHFEGTLVYADLVYGSGLRRGFANTEHLPAYYPVAVGIEHGWKLHGHRELRLRMDIVNVFDQSYELRDGSGIGVGAPQFGARRGVFGGATLAY